MRADKSLIGIIVIALIISTMITLFIVGESGGPYSIVKSEYGPSGRGRWLVGTNLLAKEPIASLRLSHFCLMNRPPLMEGVDTEGLPEEVCRRIPNLQSYLDMVAAIGQEPNLRRLKAEIAMWEDPETKVRKEYDVYLYDFSKFVLQAVPEDLMHSTERPRFSWGHLWDYYSAFACAFDQDGKLAYFFEGVADFYANKVIIIDELTIQMNADKETYYGVTREDKSEDALSIVNAPDGGVVVFEDLERNDRVSVVYSMDTSKLPLNPGGRWQTPIYDILHIVEITPDEGESDYIVNTYDPPQPQPKK